MSENTPLIIKWIYVNSFTKLYDDRGSGSDRDGALWRPTVPEVKNGQAWILGDYCQGNYGNATGSVLGVVVENDDPNNPAVVKPEYYENIWTDRGTHAHMDASLWKPCHSNPTYVALGHVANGGYHSSAYEPPHIPGLGMVRQDLLKQSTVGPVIWATYRAHGGQNLTIYSISATGLFYSQADYNAPTGIVWVPKSVISNHGYFSMENN